jgi:hypothetical protein
MERLIAADVEFTSDDLRDMVGDPDPDGNANGANNKIGSIFREFSTAGRIEKVMPSKSESNKRKQGMNFVWRKKKRRRLVKKKI